jgi:hypothetical protein
VSCLVWPGFACCKWHRQHAALSSCPVHCFRLHYHKTPYPTLCRSVFKVIPIEGSTPINGGPQKRAAEVVAEALMALELSQLRSSTGTNSGGGKNVDVGQMLQSNITMGFVNTYKVWLSRCQHTFQYMKSALSRQ